MHIRSIACALFVLVGCGHASNEPAADPGAADVRTRFAASEGRLLGLLDAGQVVSRRPDGAPDRLGEAGKWTWKALGTLSCAAAYEPMRQALARLDAAGGELVRYVPLPAEYDKDRWNLDGEIGFWEGFAGLWQRCPAYRAELAEAWALHEGKYEPPPVFDAVAAQLAAMVGRGTAPPAAKVEALGAELWAWAAATVAGRAACFRLNLALESITGLERAGGALPGRWRDLLCGTTATVDIPTWDHWCGRPGLDAYLDGFAPNVWEYRHQRCGAWETPDGQGLQTPGLDELVALRLKYGENL